MKKFLKYAQEKERCEDIPVSINTKAGVFINEARKFA